jgi:hypothetical protein
LVARGVGKELDADVPVRPEQADGDDELDIHGVLEVQHDVFQQAEVLRRVFGAELADATMRIAVWMSGCAEFAWQRSSPMFCRDVGAGSSSAGITSFNAVVRRAESFLHCTTLCTLYWRRCVLLPRMPVTVLSSWNDSIRMECNTLHFIVVRSSAQRPDNQWQHHNSSVKNSVTCALLSALRVAGLLVTSVLAAAVRHY